MGSISIEEDKAEKILAEKLGKSKENKIVTVSVGSENYNAVILTVLDYLIKKRGLSGIYVTLNKPYATLSRHLEGNNLARELYFVDAASGRSGKIDGICYFVESPQALTSLSLSITSLVNTGKSDFLIFDSVSTLLAFNDLGTTQKFVHYIVSKLRNFDQTGVLILIAEGSGNIKPFIDQICDETIRL